MKGHLLGHRIEEAMVGVVSEYFCTNICDSFKAYVCNSKLSSWLSVPPPSHFKVISKHSWDFTEMTEKHSEIAQCLQ